jgi:hypothetical protein
VIYETIECLPSDLELSADFQFSRIFFESEASASDDVELSARALAPSELLLTGATRETTANVGSDWSFVSMALSSHVFSESEGRTSNEAYSSAAFEPSAEISFSMSVVSHGVFTGSELVRASGPEVPSFWLTSFGFVTSQSFCESQSQRSRESRLSHLDLPYSLRFPNPRIASGSGSVDSEKRDGSDAFAFSTSIWVSMHIASQAFFVDSEVFGGTGPEQRSFRLTSVGFAMSGPFCESQAQVSLKLRLSHLDYSHFDRDSVDLAGSVRLFDETHYRPATDSWTRSTKLGVSFASASLGFDPSGSMISIHTDEHSRAIGGTGTEIPSLGFVISRPFRRSQTQESREYEPSHLELSEMRDDSNQFDSSPNAWFSVHGARQAIFADSEVTRGSCPEQRYLWLTSVGFLISGMVCERPSVEFSPSPVLSLVDASIADAVDADAGQVGESSEMKTVWISLAAVFALLLAVGAILLIVARRSHASLAPTDETEADGAIPIDVESSLEDLGDFMSGENALSHDRGFSTPKQMNDIDESLQIARSKVAGRPDLSEHDWPE